MSLLNILIFEKEGIALSITKIYLTPDMRSGTKVFN
jgi:hypothetical protein